MLNRVLCLNPEAYGKCLQDEIKGTAYVLKKKREHEYQKECEEEKRRKMSKEECLKYDLGKIEAAEKAALEDRKDS